MKGLRKTLELSYIVIFIGLIISGRLFYLQIISYNYYQDLSIQIRSRIIPSVAPRGIIYDRFGKILARNKPAYFLYAAVKEIKDLDNLKTFLKESLQIPGKTIDQKLSERLTSFEPLLLKKYLTTKEVVTIEEHRSDFPSLVIGSRITRDYPYGNIASHVIGYTGEISTKELKIRKGYRLNDIIGLAGIEREYDRYLKGINGGQQIEVDPLGNPIRKMKNIELIPGDDLYLTIDIELSKKADSLMSKFKGAVVILDANSGEVLTLISKPDFDPNYFSDYLTNEEWKDIQGKDHPLHNRALTGYPPASVFKIFTGLAALENKLFSNKTKFYCAGGIKVGGRHFGCWKKHGTIDFYHGIIDSCDVVFYNVGMKLGSKNIAKYAAMFGLGTPTGVDLPFEGRGLVANAKWKKKYYGQEWYPGDTLNMAIGQGYLLTSPIQLATALLPIANDNHILYQPYIVKKIINKNNDLIMQTEPKRNTRIDLSENAYTFMKNALRDVIIKGTGKRAGLKNFPIAGKTGTAETGKKKNHAWFVSYSPANDPEIVMAVFIEFGGSGGGSPAYISRELHHWWQKNRSLYGK